MSQEKIKFRAELWKNEICVGNVIQSNSTIGGGSLPGETIPTWVLSIPVKSPDKFLKKIRSAQPAVIARVHNNEILLDPRTVLIEQDGLLISCIKECLVR